MFFVGPRPYFVGVSKWVLQYGRQDWIGSLPNGGWWTFKYFLVNFPRTVVAGAQTTPELNFKIYDADGRGFSIKPIPMAAVTSPAGNRTIDATQLINVKYAGGSAVRVEVSGQVPGTGPAWVSLTLFGVRSEQRLGG